MSNKDSWNSMHLVNSYINDHTLQKPEETIMQLVKDKLKDWRMLDLGIGLGRTTLHFAPLVKEYTGIDYSFSMLKTYQKIFPEAKPNVQVRLGDVRMMRELESDYFDFILFSFNGIDYISHEDRLYALEEIKRIGKKGGIFVFSTHNLNHIDAMYSIKFGNRIKYFIYQCYRYLRLIYENGFPGKYRKKDFAILNDSAHHFKLKTYYIKPDAQIEQLEGFVFKTICFFSLKTGEEMDKAALNGASGDSWIYYMCEFPTD